MKKIKDKNKNPSEYQSVDDYSEEGIDAQQRFLFENQRLVAQLDLLFSSIEGGHSPAEAEFLRQANYEFIADMNARDAQIDELLKQQ